MTDELREEMLTTLHGLGKSIEEHGDERSRAIAGCLYCLCLAIREGVEADLMRHRQPPQHTTQTFLSHKPSVLMLLAGAGDRIARATATPDKRATNQIRASNGTSVSKSAKRGGKR